ncbi:aspartic peptidase domain-containing protein [Halenospora varia]|nr:aspartic peptidase domain-containing protein [Halenospora varia]
MDLLLVHRIEKEHISGSREGFSLDIVELPISNTNANILGRDEPPPGYHFATDLNPDYRRWCIEIGVGTPFQKLLVTTDSRAPDFMIQSTLIDPVMLVNNAAVYDPRKSTTASVVSGMSFRQVYAGGTLDYSGIIMADNLRIGNLVFAGFMFECTNKTKTVIGAGERPQLGSLGLNLDPNGMATGPTRIASWFPAIMSYLNVPVFTFDFSTRTQKGTIDFGYIDPKKYNGTIAYTSVEPGSTEWIVGISGWAVGTTFWRNSFRIIIDTADKGPMRVPRWALDNYFQWVSNNITWSEKHQTYQFPCKTQLKDVVWGIGDQEKRGISWQDLVKYYVDGTGPDAWCISDLRGGFSMDNGQELYFWGRMIQRTVFLVFDYGNRRIGFGDKDN